MDSSDKKPQKAKGRLTKRLVVALWITLGLYLLAYVLNSSLGGYWLAPARDGRDRFTPELGGLPITDAIMWQPRFGSRSLGRLDRAGAFFGPLIQIDQRYFHKTHYLVDPDYKAWIDRLPRSKVHPAFRNDFDAFTRTNHAASGNGAVMLSFHTEPFEPAVPDQTRWRSSITAYE